MTRGIPVLMYHALIADNKPATGRKSVAITVDAFKAQMDWLHSNGYKTLNSRQTEDYLNGLPLPDGKYCILTFDDGYYSWYRYAREILAAYDFTATLFLSTAYVDELYDLPDFILDEDDRPLTWPEVRALSESGWSIQAHGHYHHHWTSISLEELREDIQACRDAIEQNTGTKASYVAYPYGVYSAQTLQLLQQMGFKAAYTVHDGLLTPSPDRFRLPRIEINSTDTLTTFQHKVRTGYASGTRAIKSKIRDLVYANPMLKDIIKAVVP